MSLQRISDFAENQGADHFYLLIREKPAYLHAEVFAQVDSSNSIIFNDLIWLAFR
jgi:hypothetical protein